MSRLRWPDSTNSVSDVPGTIQLGSSFLLARLGPSRCPRQALVAPFPEHLGTMTPTLHGVPAARRTIATATLVGHEVPAALLAPPRAAPGLEVPQKHEGVGREETGRSSLFTAAAGRGIVPEHRRGRQGEGAHERERPARQPVARIPARPRPAKGPRRRRPAQRTHSTWRTPTPARHRTPRNAVLTVGAGRSGRARHRPEESTLGDRRLAVHAVPRKST